MTNAPKTEYTYDPHNNVLTVRNPEGNVTETTYNALDQPLTVKDPRGTYTINTYDNKGNLTSTRVAKTLTGPALIETTIVYRSDGRPVTQTIAIEGEVAVTQYEYDGSGYLKKRTLCHATSYTYDRTVTA